MNAANLVRGIVFWLVYMLSHIFIGRHIALFDYGFCFFYVGVILILPQETNRIYLMLIAFLTGIIADSFDNTLGMHASATVLIAYLRNFLLQYQLSDKIEQNLPFLSLSTLGFPLLLSYMLPLIFIHHTLIFIVEAASWSLFLQTALKIICSVLLTTILVAFSQLFVKK